MREQANEALLVDIRAVYQIEPQDLWQSKNPCLFAAQRGTFVGAIGWRA